MKKVYLLWHTHALDDGNDDEKLIGVYESEYAAREAQSRVGGQPGFRRNPEGFEIAGYELGKDHWTEGYVTMGGDQVIERGERGRNGIEE